MMFLWQYLFRLAGLVLLLLLSLLTPELVTADPVTYAYTGAPFTTCYSFASSPCSLYSISGIITLAAPLAPGDDSPQALHPASFSFTDGDPNHTLFSDLNSSAAYFYVDDINADGLPTSWAFFIGYGVNDCSSGFQITSYATNPFDCSGGFYGGWQGQSAGQGFWSKVSDPPPQSTSEPSSVLLLGSGLVLIFVFVRFIAHHRYEDSGC